MGRITKYEPLKDYLIKCNNQSERLSYQEIEEIVGKSLPRSAYKYREWWANGGHTQANSWLDAGWKIEEVNLGEYIIFAKTNQKPLTPRSIKIGQKYKHFKGNEYYVLYLAKHSETLEDLVVYQALYGEKGIWIRPLNMFLEQVEVDGKRVNRFEEYTG